MTTYYYRDVPQPTNFRVRNGTYRAELSFEYRYLSETTLDLVIDWCHSELFLDRWAVYRATDYYDLNGNSRADCFIIICEFVDLTDAALFKMHWNTGR